MALLAELMMVQAGGPGSGCRGDNCGRPAGSGASAPISEGEKEDLVWRWVSGGSRADESNQVLQRAARELGANMGKFGAGSQSRDGKILEAIYHETQGKLASSSEPIELWRGTQSPDAYSPLESWTEDVAIAKSLQKEIHRGMVICFMHSSRGVLW